jgi:hypothetical protein
VLVLVLLVVRPEKLSGPVRMLDVIRHSVEFVVAHDDLSAAVVDHPLDYLEHLQLVITAVDEITDEDRLTLRVAIASCSFVAVTQALQQLDQWLCTYVDVSDDVVALVGLRFLRTRRIGSDRCRH